MNFGQKLLALPLLLFTAGLCAQELEPRAYSPSPTGVGFIAVAGARSTGEVLFDPSLPVRDVTATLNTGVLVYGRTFGLAGRSASAVFATPYVRGDASGDVGETRRSVHRSGLADVRLRLSMNLFGGPALSLREFARHTPQTTLGLSLSVAAPTGQYDSAEQVNIGTNRWAFKPELGLSIPRGKWIFDAYAGVWLFTDNTRYRGQSSLSQDPMPTLQAHVSYTLRPRMWLAFDSTYYFDGRTSVDGAPQPNRQENVRVGLTLSVPAGKNQSIKFNYSDGATTRVGSDFRTFGIAWQYTWIGAPAR